jgi:hypothetical protein
MPSTDSFKSAVLFSEHTASNGRIITECRIGNDIEGNGHGLLKVGICMEGWRKTMKTCHNS